MDYELELETVQTWLKSVGGLNSWKRSGLPPSLPRPVVVWETPYRSRKKQLNRYAYTQTVKYYGKLYINSVDEILRLQNTLVQDLENKTGLLEVKDAGVSVGYMKAVELTFNQTEGLDVPFTLSYEVSYSRTKPTPTPAPKYVYTKVTCSRETNKGV
ncbi:MAG: hypothetical protein RSE04_06005 [Hydrogenoanaerobacterium sp.]